MNHCKNLKKRKNKPYCKLIEKEITFSCCRECNKKEYKKSDIKISKKKNAQLQRNKSPKNTKMHNKSKKLIKLERNRFSVFTDDLTSCYLCGRKKDDLHEIFGGRNRINSIRRGFVLPLCRKCHSLNQNNLFFNDYWHRQGQIYWEENIGAREEFIEVFRRNYLE